MTATNLSYLIAGFGSAVVLLGVCCLIGRWLYAGADDTPFVTCRVCVTCREPYPDWEAASVRKCHSCRWGRMDNRPLILSLAERVYKQSELLSKKAERPVTLVRAGVRA